MRKSNILNSAIGKIILITFLLFSIPLFAAQNDLGKEIHNVTTKILNLCKANKFSEAAVYISYHGIDKKRERKDHYNFTVRSEKLKVKRICRKIRSLQLLSDSFKLGNVKTVKKNSLSYSVNVEFKSSDQTIDIKFVYVKVKGHYLLSDID